jgi:colanic acid/amylovoran biosynthesis protein
MNKLISVPAKIALSLFFAGGTYWSFSKIWQSFFTPNPIAAIGISTISSVIFLMAELTLNSGALANSLKQFDSQGNQRKLIREVLRLIEWLISIREAMFLSWFSITLGVSAAIRQSGPVGKKGVVIIPSDTTDVDGSLGDQALFLGVMSASNTRNATLVLSENAEIHSPIFSGVAFIKAWNGFCAGWRLGAVMRSTSALYIIGADIMDGFYSTRVSLQRLCLARLFAVRNVPVVIVGFSFNQSPEKKVIREFLRLPESVRVCLRDEVSLERFKNFVDRDKGVLVADVAFLVHEIDGSAIAKIVSPWVAREKELGRLALGINVNPHVVAHLPNGSESILATSVAECCRMLIDDGVSIILIPHDFRAGCADLRVMNQIGDSIRESSAGHILVLSNRFTAQEIKSVSTTLDLLFSARMHLAIGALSMCVPVCGMQYQGKFEGMFRHFGQGTDLFISPEDALNPRNLYLFLKRHLGARSVLKEKIVSHLPAVMALAKLNVINLGK